MKKALIVIDIQNDYFTHGAFPLDNVQEACQGAIEAIEQAKKENWLIIGVQHINQTTASLFRPETEGAAIHPTILNALNNAPIIIKHHADCFYETDLQEVLQKNNITDLYLTGMMTQHCVTHTTLSPLTHNMKVNIIAKGCAAPSRVIHELALKGLSTRCHILK